VVPIAYFSKVLASKDKQIKLHPRSVAIGIQFAGILSIKLSTHFGRSYISVSLEHKKH